MLRPGPGKRQARPPHERALASQGVRNDEGPRCDGVVHGDGGDVFVVVTTPGVAPQVDISRIMPAIGVVLPHTVVYDAVELIQCFAWKTASSREA